MRHSELSDAQKSIVCDQIAVRNYSNCIVKSIFAYTMHKQ